MNDQADDLPELQWREVNIMSNAFSPAQRWALELAWATLSDSERWDVIAGVRERLAVLGLYVLPDDVSLRGCVYDPRD